MKQRIDIRPFSGRSFDLEVRRRGTSLCGLWVVLLGQSQAAGDGAESSVSGGELAPEEAIDGETPPVDMLGLLSGDGMWVGAGGVSFLPIREASKGAVDSLEMLAE
jgi:hypothetical protein